VGILTSKLSQRLHRKHISMCRRPPQLNLPALLTLLLLVALPAAADVSKVAKDDPATPPAETAGADRNDGLSADLIYAVLVGQVAQQRGDHRMAFTHFLHGARLAHDPSLAELAARSALALADAEAVQRAIDGWLEITPDSRTAHQLAAYVRLEANDVAGAMAHLRRVISLASEVGEDGFLQAARLVQKLGQPERRIELMETLTASEPQNPEGWFARAMVAAGAERHDEAAAAARKAVELRPDWNEPRVFLIQLFLTQGKRDEARTTLEEFVAQNPGDQSLRMLYAQMLVEDQEYAQAREMFEVLLEASPKEPDVLFALGVLSLQLEDLPAARDYFTRLRDTGERRDQSTYYLGQVEELAEDPESAIGWYRQVEGDHALDARVRIARLRARAGDVDAAREMLQQLRDQWAEDAITLYLIEAEILRDIDRKREAMTVYDTALAAHPDDADLLYSRALHAVSLDRLDVLEADLRKVIAQDPDHADALNALGYTLADRTDRFEEALELIERALELKPDDAAILDSMGWVRYRLGQLDEAERYLRKAYEQLPDGEIAAHLGEVLWARGERDSAWRIWEEALAEDPQHEYLLRVIGRHRMTSSSGAEPH
jgi:tetratricopeptide (TPR) repeat protein